MKKTILLIVFAVAVFSLSSSADFITIVGYEVTGVVANSAELPVTESSTGIQATSITRSDELGVGTSTASSSFNSSKWNITDIFDEDSHYLTFTITTAPGYEVSIEKLSYNIESSDTAPNQGRWGYKIEDGEFVLQEPLTVQPSSPFGDGTWDISDLNEASGTIEFRYWQFGTDRVDGEDGDSSASGTSRIRNLSGYDVHLTGTVIPEPTSIGLLVLMGGLLLIRRRLRG